MNATILVVTADSKERESWKQLLGRQGYRVISIATGQRVIDLCAHLGPDLVLVDACLPDVPGLEICRRLKEDPRNRLTPVVLITTFLDEAASVSVRGSGADDVWGPHPSPWEALTRIQSLLQLKTYIDEQAKEVILTLARTIEARDKYTRGHCERIAHFAVRLGAKIGLSSQELEALQVAGTLHDVGKVAVPDAVLMKAGPLNCHELMIMQRHPIEGERICSPLNCLRRVLPIIRHHHERMDGSGYPDGLSGDSIPVAARILQIVDIFDALTTDRPYRRALSTRDAFATLYKEADHGWLDADLIRIFALVAAAPKSAKIIDIQERIGSPGLAS